MHRAHRWCPFVAALAALSAALGAQTPSRYDEALARYKECIRRLPFFHHTMGREHLAKTGMPEALQVLIADYAGSKAYPDYTRYTLAALFGRYFHDGDSAVVLQQLRQKHDKPVDAWLWANALRIEANRLGPDGAMAIVREAKTALHRAAAIVGLGKARQGDVFDAIAAVCAQFPKADKQADRFLLLGAMSGAVFDNKSKVRSAQARIGMTAYINLLRPEVELPHLAKVQMARHLMWTLDGPGLMVTPEPWLALLEQDAPKRPKAGSTVTSQPRFFGIETEGERFCYVIDMSDSMCKEITPASKPQTGPITGPKPKKPAKGELLDEDDLPWHAIKTRFDLAREHLKISLQRLPSDKYFSLVWFGSESGTLPSCPGLMKATKQNIARVIKDLDAITAIMPGEPGPDGRPVDPKVAPDGMLRGKTNMHSGLRRAFGLSGKGFVEQNAYVDAGPLVEGCDTIFLLSDGAPSWDDFHLVDKDYGEGEVIIDTEYKTPAPRQPEIHYHGPYDQPDWLVEDVGRMNAFRRIRMHCIGIGEANEGLLDQLAQMGHGEVYIFGKPKKEPAEAPTGGGKK